MEERRARVRDQVEARRATLEARLQRLRTRRRDGAEAAYVEGRLRDLEGILRTQTWAGLSDTVIRRLDDWLGATRHLERGRGRGRRRARR